MKRKDLVGLIIMDGFGYPIDVNRSAIKEDNTKSLQHFASVYPHTLIGASEEYVGLPKDQAGTSEVGHLTIGSGRVILQPLMRLNKEIENGDFYKNKVLLSNMQNAKNSALHILGLISDGGIHSHINHLFALIKMAKDNNVENVCIHFFADGRDVPPKSAHKYIKLVEDYCKKIGVGKIVSVMGRYYALDRDKNWDRVEYAYNAMVYGKGYTAGSASEAVNMAYERKETDEFILPTVLVDDKNIPLGLIKSGDSVISFNFRADRERQLAYVFDPKNTLSYTDKKLNTNFVCMMEYDENLTFCEVAYPKEIINNLLSEYLSNKGYRQLKIAETEKYAHVTFFFNNGKLDEYPLEDRVLINSEKMKSYASCPEMSANIICEKVIEAIKENKYDEIVINFANCDMVGHSGDIDAAYRAVEIVDDCVKRVTDEFLKVGGSVIITADHGNADIMKYPDGSPHTAHTTSKVPLILVSEKYKNSKLRENGNLSDIAPTILELMGETKPTEMSGASLIQ